MIVMEQNDQIIVFKKYDNSIEANLAKTKLDAHGIPCFLTEENLTNLYPFQNLLLFGVRLHIFSSDRNDAEQVLNERVVTDQDVPMCPSCHSQNIAIEHSSKLTPRAGRLALGLFMGAILPLKKVYTCKDCMREFETL